MQLDPTACNADFEPCAGRTFRFSRGLVGLPADAHTRADEDEQPDRRAAGARIVRLISASVGE
jgi:hypothetical protein